MGGRRGLLIMGLLGGRGVRNRIRATAVVDIRESTVNGVWRMLSGVQEHDTGGL